MIIDDLKGMICPEENIELTNSEGCKFYVGKMRNVDRCYSTYHVRGVRLGKKTDYGVFGWPEVNYVEIEVNCFSS